MNGCDCGRYVDGRLMQCRRHPAAADHPPRATLAADRRPFGYTLVFANGDIEQGHLIRSQTAETAAADLVLAYWRNLPSMAAAADDWTRYEAARGVPVEIIIRPFNSDGVLYRASTRWAA